MTAPPPTLEPTLDEQIEWMRMEAQYYKGSPRPAILASLERLKALDEQPDEYRYKPKMASALDARNEGDDDCSPASRDGRQGARLRHPDDNREMIDTLDDIAAYFRKEAAYEAENIGNGGSTIALSRWKRYYTALENMSHDLKTAYAPAATAEGDTK